MTTRTPLWDPPPLTIVILLSPVDESLRADVDHAFTNIPTESKQWVK